MICRKDACIVVEKMENVRGKNTRRKHLNKTKKKSWRKVNIDQVEDFLEDERLQERTGGKVAEKSDEALFFVDKKKRDPVKVIEDKKERKRKAQERLKNVEKELKPPPPLKKDKRRPDVIEKSLIAEKKRHKRATKDRELARSRKLEQQRFMRKEATYDLWGDKLEKEQEGEDPHYLKVTRKTRARVPIHHQNTISKIPAVEVPHPGASYNPAYDDHQALLDEANKKEEERLREEEKIWRALNANFPAPEDAPTEKSRLEELSAGLFDNEDEGEEVGDIDKLSVNPPVRREDKKDEKKRKKEKRRKEVEKILQKEKLKKQQDSTFYRLKSIKATIQAEESEISVKAMKKAQIKAGQLYRTRRLGRLKYEEPDLEVKLSDELVGSLREIKPEGHLLADRLKSLQKRNIIEPREKHRTKRKYKAKWVVKRNHREIPTQV